MTQKGVPYIKIFLTFYKEQPRILDHVPVLTATNLLFITPS